MNRQELKEAREKWERHCKWVQESTISCFADSKESKQDRIKRAKKDYEYFTQTYFTHYCIDKDGNIIPNADFHNEWAYKVLADKNFKGVAEWPREHAKSVHNTIILPLWLKIHGELDGAILTSKSEDDAKRLLGDIQAELKDNQKYIHDFGLQFNEGSWEDGKFITKDEVFFYAKGRGQSPRGIRYKNKRPNLGIADDMDDDEIVNNQHRVIKVVKWLLSAFIGALALKQSRFIMVGNRFHPKSILAHMVGDVDVNDPKRKGLHHSKIYATTNGELDGEPTWWQNFSKAVLKARFDFIGTIETLKEFFHKYVLEGKRFKNEWIHWDKIPPLKEMDALIVYFDPSYKSTSSSDYKAIRFWAKKGIKRYLIKSFVRQTTITQAVKWMYDLYETLPENVQQQVEWRMEEVFLQDQFFEDFEDEALMRGYFLPIRGDKRDKPDKFARIESMTPMYERGHVIWNEEERKSPDAQNGLIQYMGFEKGSPIHDDALDADEGANYLLNKKTYIQKNKPVIGTDQNNNLW
jgi:phage terminase large subunit-like protein